MLTISELLDYGKTQLEESGNEYAKYERKVLLEHVLNVNYLYMMMNGDEQVADDKVSEYKGLIERRCGHYPLQYLLGHAHFMDYTFYVDENVLIPRNDTEILVETVNELYNDITVGSLTKPNDNTVKLLDLCCGSGCIGISLKLYHPATDLTLSDISDKALAVAKRNLDKYDIRDAKLNCGSMFEGARERYDIIVCNPPYIESRVVDTLMPEVKDYEPRLALDGGDDGLDFYKSILSVAKNYISDKGYIFFEIGYDQGESVSRLMREAGFMDTTVRKDYAEMDRVVYGHL